MDNFKIVQWEGVKEMAWVTVLGPDMEQVEYRLNEQCGCDAEHVQADARLGDAGDLEWIGSGLADVGLIAGEAVDKDAARALMSGRHPQTGERLVEPKKAVDPRAKLGARELVEAVTAACAARNTTVPGLLGNPRLVKRFERLEKGLLREGEAHRLPVREAEAIAEAAGLAPAAVYRARELAEARRYADKRIRVGNRGYDLTLDLPKRFSAAVALLRALGHEQTARGLEEAFLTAARETVAAMESWAGYAMVGHHGEGQAAARIETSGLLGWMTVHRSARPVDGLPGDPHLHVHVSLANMVLAADGKWRTVGAGGRDIHRHAHAADALVKARLRQLTETRFGMRWKRDEETGAWDVDGVPDAIRREFSRRMAQIAEASCEGMSTYEQKLIARQLAEAKEDLATTDVYASWLQRAEAVVGDVEAMLHAAVPGPGGAGAGVAGPGGGPRMPSPQETTAYIWRRNGGLTAARKVVTRADVLAAVLDACPHGTEDLPAGERLTDDVLALEGEAVPLPPRGAKHLTNSQRYTHTSVLEAEQTIADTATARLGEGAAQVTPAAAELAVSTFEASQGFELTVEQRAAVHRLLLGGHGVDSVEGLAGSGKSTLMSAARSGWEAAGLRVAGATTAAVAAAMLQTASGISSRTIASWLYEIEGGGAGLRDVDVLVIDEAAMVDDRDTAALLRHASQHGTKVVTIGDPKQLRAIGIGGGFAAVHRIVDGVALTENRRQRDAVERAALEVWREGERRPALGIFADHDHVHAVEASLEAHAAMLEAWQAASGRWAADPHGLIAGLLLLAARNEDVDLLNGSIRTLRKDAGELAYGHRWGLAGGGVLELAVGDIVRVRRNDYRSRRSGEVDVLNGYRGVITDTDRERGVRVEWRRPGPDGDRIEGAWITGEQIAAGALSYGYATTIAAAQGTTCDLSLVYGPGADAYSLYPALSRAREATHLWLPKAALEDDATQRRLGEARSPQELLQRAVAAYATLLERDQPDRMVTDELADAERPAAATAVPSWRKRDFGHVPTGRLTPATTAAEEAADRADLLARRGASRLDALAAVLDTDQAPGRQRVARVTGHLEHAQAQLRQAADLQRQKDELVALNTSEQAVEQRIQARASQARTRITGQRGRLLADAQLLQERIRQRAEQISALQQDLDQQTASAQQEAAAAGQMMDIPLQPTGDVEQLQHAVTQLRDAVPAYRQRMSIRDRSQHEDLVHETGQQREEAARQRARAAALRREARFRQQLTPDQAARETRERTEAARLAQQHRQVQQTRRHEHAQPPTPGGQRQPSGGIRS